MTFLSLILALGIVYWLGSVRFMHWDVWYQSLVTRLQSIPAIAANPIAGISLSLFIPCFALALLIVIVVKLADSYWLILINVPILLYCIDRSDFIAEVQAYIDIVERGDTVAANHWVDEMRGNVEHTGTDINDWRELHTEALKVIAYRGFEKTFAVLFWFFIAGALGALIYRLSVLYREFSESDSLQTQLASRWLWLLELPSVRLMGVTWALVGNFDTTPLRDNLLNMEKTSIEILNTCLRGALGAPAPVPTKVNIENSDLEGQDITLSEDSVDIIEDLTGAIITTQVEPAYSFALVKSSIPLYTRSLLFWVCAIAFATLFIA